MSLIEYCFYAILPIHIFFFFFQAEDGIRDIGVTGVQTCALPISGLLHDVLRIRLAKSASFTRWDARPLTDEQIRYAREDVEHLFALSDELQRRLSEKGRLDWAREECRAVQNASDERDPEEVWRRLPRISGLSAQERAVAKELAAWRERTAERDDRPVGSVVRDQTVVRSEEHTSELQSRQYL